MLPSPFDLIKRWPRAVMLVSALIIHGDQKHGGDGRAASGRGTPLDNQQYGLEYSYEKLSRHMTRRLEGRVVDPETNLFEAAAIAWHGLNALEAEAKAHNMTVNQIIMGQEFRNQLIREEYADV